MVSRSKPAVPSDARHVGPPAQAGDPVGRFLSSVVPHLVDGIGKNASTGNGGAVKPGVATHALYTFGCATGLRPVTLVDPALRAKAARRLAEFSEDMACRQRGACKGGAI